MQLELITQEPLTPRRPAPLLFVHGMWHAAWCWAEHFLPFFAEHGYAAAALSLRGHGASEGRARLRWYTVADYVADVAQVAANLPSPPILVGHSLGGAVVLKYLETHPAPAAVLLASVPPRGVIPATVRRFMRQPSAMLRANLTLRMYPLVDTPERAREALFSPDLSPDLLARYQARLQDESYRAYWDILGLNLPNPAKIKTPLLVLGAENDRIFAVDEVKATARVYGTQAEMFPNMAHDMMLETGWRQVAERMLAWFGERGL